MRPFEKVKSDLPELNRLQDSLKDIIESIQTDIIDGRRIEVTFSAGALTRTVGHKLGRDLVGWHVVRKDAFADIKELSAGDRTLVLEADGAVKVTLWVF